MLQFSEFVWALSYSGWDVFNKFLLIDATDRSKISSDQKRFFIALSLYPLSFFANTPFKEGREQILNYCSLKPLKPFYPCFKTETTEKMYWANKKFENVWIVYFLVHFPEFSKSISVVFN